MENKLTQVTGAALSVARTRPESDSHLSVAVFDHPDPPLNQRHTQSEISIFQTANQKGSWFQQVPVNQLSLPSNGLSEDSHARSVARPDQTAHNAAVARSDLGIVAEESAPWNPHRDCGRRADRLLCRECTSPFVDLPTKYSTLVEKESLRSS